jgi:pyruvate-formate lyase-activating enzyme
MLTPKLTCTYCHGPDGKPATVPDEAYIQDTTSQEWQCPYCHSWNVRPEAAQASTQAWDLRDDDGHMHSPVWYLDLWLVEREAYLTTLRKDIREMTTDEEEAHMVELDRMLNQLDKAEEYVNKLFGYTGPLPE